MYNLKYSTKFKKDMKRLEKSGRKKKDFTAIKEIIRKLAIPEILPDNNGNTIRVSFLHPFPSMPLH